MIDVETANRLVLQFLAANPSFGQGHSDQVDHIERSVAGQAGTLSFEDTAKVHEVIWDLIVQRVLTVGSKMSCGWPFLSLTEFGKKIIKDQRWSPYDPDGYLRELTDKAPRVGKRCEMYIAEALTSFRGGAYLATSVMLGAASEGSMLDLFDRYHDAMAKGGLHEHSGYQEKLRKAHSFYEKYKVFHRYFEAAKAKLPGNLGEDLDGQMDGVLNLIRNYRNEAGHPTGTKIERMGAFRNLVLFIEYCRRVEAVGDCLESNPERLAQP
ncbi:MAG: hypothetical protein ACLQOO_08640 [Terriglobia bacterium]